MKYQIVTCCAHARTDRGMMYYAYPLQHLLHAKEHVSVWTTVRSEDAMRQLGFSVSVFDPFEVVKQYFCSDDWLPRLRELHPRPRSPEVVCPELLCLWLSKTWMLWTESMRTDADVFVWLDAGMPVSYFSAHSLDNYIRDGMRYRGMSDFLVTIRDRIDRSGGVVAGKVRNGADIRTMMEDRRLAGCFLAVRSDFTEDYFQAVRRAWSVAVDEGVVTTDEGALEMAAAELGFDSIPACDLARMYR